MIREAHKANPNPEPSPPRSKYIQRFLKVKFSDPTVFEMTFNFGPLSRLMQRIGNHDS
jgi:hypothetical protein